MDVIHCRLLFTGHSLHSGLLKIPPATNAANYNFCKQLVNNWESADWVLFLRCLGSPFLWIRIMLAFLYAMGTF